MNNEFLLSNEIAAMFLRMTIVLFIGWVAIAMLRQRNPSIAIVVARCMLVAMWVGPIVILTGLSLKLPVLPGTKTDLAAANREPLGIAGEYSETRVKSNPNIAKNNPKSNQELNAEARQVSSSDIDDGGNENQFEPKGGGSLFGQIQDEVETGSEDNFAEALPESRKDSRALRADSPKRAEVNSPIAADAPAGAKINFWLQVTNLFAAIWLIVTSILLIRFVIRLVRTAKVVRRSKPASEQLASALQRIAVRLNIKTDCSIRISRDVPGPCTVGCFKPVLLLPTKWLETESELTKLQTEMILAHELTHANSHDAAWDAIGQISRAVWWFHPLTTLVAREHRLACEHRCDSAASQIAGDVDSYRRQLACWALTIREQHRTESLSQHAALISLSMAERSLMLERLKWLKNEAINETVSMSKRIFAVAGALVICLSFMLIQPTPRLSAFPQDAVVQVQGEGKDGSEGTKDSPEPPAEAEAAAIAPMEEHLIRATLPTSPRSVDEGLDVNWNHPIKVVCTISNEADEPIEGAEIRLVLLYDQNRKTCSFDNQMKSLTNSRGEIEILLPGRTDDFSLWGKADGYASFDNEYFKPIPKIEFRMKSGRRIRVRATNEDDELLPNAYPIVESSNLFGREFTKQEDGTHLSPVLPTERRWMWVVDGSNKDEPILFSDLIDLSDDMAVDSAGINHAELKRGVRLEGALSDEVPRPIKNGFVHVAVRDGEKHRIESFNRSGLVWHEYTTINPNGTFVFESLPRDTHAQIFAICEGWQSTSPKEDSVREYFTKHDAGSERLIVETTRRYNSNPQLFHLDSSKSPVKIAVPCRESTSLNVRVVDPSGTPITGAMVSMSPNLAFFGDLVIPGVQMWNKDLVRGDGRVFGGGQNDFSSFATESFLDVTTDATGVARIRNLPNLSDSFEVEADGYVMSAYPTTGPEKPGRYGLTGDMTPGKVKKMTITMERNLKPVGRELMVIDQHGKPLKDLTLTIIAIASDAENPDWQQWSVRRFGATSSEKTNGNGEVRLLYPETIDDGNVEMLTVRIDGRVSKHRSLRRDILIPAKADGQGFRVNVQPPTETETKLGRWSAATAEYADILTGNGSSPKEILQSFLERNDLLSLRQLLAANNYDAVTPLELKVELNRTELQNKSPVEKVKTSGGERIIAMATVRPKGAKWADKPNRGFTPEAAFIFDDEGKLIRVLGGRATDGDDAMLANLGGTFDFFVRISGFESHPPYEYASRWYKVDAPEKPALTIYHQANSSSFAPFQGTKFPLAEYCFLGFGLNGVKIKNNATGRNELGAQVPRTIVWDRPTGKFYGELSQTYDDKPVFKVVADESQAFKPVTAKSDEVVVIGGRRDFQNWHMWHVVVQDGQALTAILEIHDSDGKTLRTIRKDELGPGQHNLQLLFEDAESKDGAKIDLAERTLLATAVDAKKIHDEIVKFKIPHFTVDETPTLSGNYSYATSRPPLRIIEKQSSDKTQKLVWVIE